MSSSTGELARMPFPSQTLRCECGSECTVSNGQWVCPACGLVQESLMVPSISSYRSSAVMRYGFHLLDRSLKPRADVYASAETEKKAEAETKAGAGAEAQAAEPPSMPVGSAGASDTRAKYFFRLAHTICRLASLVDDVAREAAALALARPMTCRESTLHVLAAVMYTSARMGGAHVRLPGEWEDVVQQLNLRRPGRPAGDGHRPIKMWTVLEYMKQTYGPLPEGGGYWNRFLSLLPLKAVRRASILLEAPKNASQAGGAILLADYDSRVTEEGLTKLKIRPDLARAAMRSLVLDLRPGKSPCSQNWKGVKGRERGRIDMRPFHTLYRLCDLLEMPWYVEEAAARRIRRRQLEGKSVGRLAAAAVLYATSLSSLSPSPSPSPSPSLSPSLSPSISPALPSLSPSSSPGSGSGSEVGRRYDAYRLPGEWSRALKEVGLTMDIQDILYTVRRRTDILNGLEGGTVRNGNGNCGGTLDRFVYRVGTIAMVPKPRLETLINFVRLSAGAPAANRNPAVTALAALSALGFINLHDKETRARLERAGVSIGHRRKRQIRLRQIEEERRRLLEAWGRAVGREPLAGVLRAWFGSYGDMNGKLRSG